MAEVGCLGICDLTHSIATIPIIDMQGVDAWQIDKVNFVAEYNQWMESPAFVDSYGLADSGQCHRGCARGRARVD